MGKIKLLELEIAQAMEEKKDSSGQLEYVGVKLNELQNAKLLSFWVQKSLIMEASKDVGIDTSDQKSVKFSVVLRGKKHKKGEILGTGEFDKYSISKPFSIDWNEPDVYKEGLPAYAVANFPATVAKKLDAFMDQDSKDFERQGFAILEKKAKENKKFKPIEIDIANATGQDLYTTIVSAADALTELVDPKVGIDLIRANQIVIFARQDILTKISTFTMKGDNAAVSAKLGAYSLGMLGGYSTFSCPYLKEASVIITTTFSMGNARKIIAANAGKIDNLSNDLGAYLETTNISDVLFNMIPTAIIHKPKNG
ncbi:hypothetical protein [Metamycoplasma hyosynoviae]|uniref:Uncharacterized protein n=1 Tax=Metamycoplasma hyosynoviae TaxID=29559 RepID=A0A063YLR5_9BACT|nr:hypothetical protein [Metamycoplasma hyosynoviae]KDE45237.1 hypothetical protein NPL4_01910 [Metamycoplasma hyosynoviae]MDC8900396.1 hypothetical protein [Metamycoplasma hyosynoviae]MDC8917315.1 hypothetical protein [Metamycoplasma hyosynoviae]MDC8920546.1 hypothetical protein [Metamycoplasma hyosynoviae]MDD1359375.1 hypothetical protein [Metamycoplasma hyosynoviae]